jgi:D-alanine-D-alanine ligase
MTKKVSVLMGGWSAEREVSLVSGAAVARGLGEGGYQVSSIDVGRDPQRLIEQLTPKPDAVFNALHGRWGEDGCIQGLLDIMAIPYTHSGLLASALAMHKPLAKRVFAAAGIPIADGRIVARDELLAGDPMPRPYVIKPLNEGSSVGVHIVHDETSRTLLTEGEWPFGGQVMVERFVPGRELTVAVMGDRALAVTEITTARGFYDYDAKYKPGGSRHVIPAELSPALYAETLALALAAHQALGCRGVSRADFRLDGERLVILEVNTQPGMTPTSLVPEQAAYAGIAFADLVGWMVETAEYDA